jgi:hypothetical protein
MNTIEHSIGELDAAVSRLERAVDRLFERSGDPGVARRQVEAMMTDRDDLAHKLDASLAREAELKILADEASEALGSAIAEVRAVLGRDRQS